MARYRVQGPDGAVHVFDGPDDATPEQVTAAAAQQFGSAAPAKPTEEAPGVIASTAAGLGKGFGQTVLGAQHWLGRGIQAAGDLMSPDERTLSTLIAGPKRGMVQSAGDWLVKDAAEGKAKLGGEVAPYKEAHPIATGAGEVGGEVIATLPVGGALAKGASMIPGVAKAAPALVEAIRTGGMRAGGVPGAVDLATRAVGGAITGGTSAALADPDHAATGVAIGGAIPVVGKIAGAIGNAAAGVVRPFLQSGQERIVGDTLRTFARDPAAARANLQSAVQVIPGSAPTAIMAAGDEGLAGLGRTMQSASPQFAAELAQRQAAQNAARTSAIEGIAGNTGKIASAKAARDTATDAMREAALDAAGAVPADSIVSRLGSMLRNPSNAGRIAQQALSNVRDQIGQFVENGAIDSRALYAIRKDINDVLSGKLQGETGNLKHASGQLIQAKDLIDSAIEQAGSRVQQSGGTALMPAGANIARAGAAPIGSAGPRASWRQYLDTYSKQSVPINQMELLDDVMKRVQTGTVDSGGNLVLSAAKLNGILKNEGQDLLKKLAPDQIDLLRRLAADLNASQLATSSGKAAGSNTVQNLAGANLLQSALGAKLGGSTPVTSTIGRVLELPYGRANKQITDRLGNALLDPQEAERLMRDPATKSAIDKLFSGAAPIGYRAAPLLGAQ